MAVDILAYSKRIVDEGPEALVALAADSTVSAHDKREIVALALYQIRYEQNRREARSARQRRAMQLLRSLLSQRQREDLRRSGYVIVQGSLGNLYELWPRTGVVWRVIRKGKRWRRLASYCLHDYAEDDPTFVPMGFPDEGKRSLLPAADRSVGHLLLLSADEAEFRRLANESMGYGVEFEWHMQIQAERRQIDTQIAA